MKNLAKQPLYRTYFVNNGIIYNIVNSTSPTYDSHAIIYKEGSDFPRLEFKDFDDKTQTYYFDSLIQDGDKLEEGAFSKICHECSPEQEMQLFDYFKFLCEQQIAKVIADNEKLKYSDYYNPDVKNGNNLNLFGVPLFMFKQTCHSIVNSWPIRVYNRSHSANVLEDDLIDFTEEKFNELLNNEILKRARKAANNAIYKYGKKVDELTVEDI